MRARDLIKRKAFKYLSSEFLIDYESKKVFNLNGVGLVTKPNLLNEALNETQTTSQPQENTMTDSEKQEFKQLKQDNNALKETNKTIKRRCNKKAKNCKPNLTHYRLIQQST
ncbi:phage protease [Abyssogena phaseoliformis symbiont]|uniref:phage protease n=1 Tax=Abyssogena phaseoliformis symbiont TaxID=596095 RepID=UPI001CED272F|nr:phage protease [Abyssogena phaseoliformis symbiont]